ncbi:MAG: methyl-accepting chemotaxis protein [Spirochaetota bacterium]
MAKKVKKPELGMMPVVGVMLAILAASSFTILNIVTAPGQIAWQAIVSLAFLAIAVAACAALMVQYRASRRRFKLIGQVLVSRGKEEADIGALISAAHDTGFVEEIEALGSFLINLNDDIVLLQRSGIKFDLFASDILFSSRNLAHQAESELAMLVALRERSEAYYTKLLATSRELLTLTETVGAYVAGAESLKERALSSRELLEEVSQATSAASEGAKGGAASLAATGASATALTKGIKELDAVAEKEAAEAKRIVAALREIEDIVERTHVLATNASIEAAHAGTRGAGFAVIAQEIRKLASSSRASLADISSLLSSIAKGIQDSARLSSEASGSAQRLGSAMADSQSRFAAIVDRVGAVDRILGRFSGVFSDQIKAASSLATEAGEASLRIRSFGQVFGDGATDCQVIAEAAGKAEIGARDAQRSSRVLAQLSGYLKVGGLERNRVLRKYRVLESAESLRFARSENRQLLLYNLEVVSEQGEALGYLGDLSPSGMLLLSDTEIAIGSKRRVRIVFPLTSEGERSVGVSLEVRRLERDPDGYRLGCAFVDVNAVAKTAISDLLSTLALDALTQSKAGVPIPSLRDAADVTDAEELEDL